jgi:hypothetical protein
MAVWVTRVRLLVCQEWLLSAFPALGAEAEVSYYFYISRCQNGVFDVEKLFVCIRKNLLPVSRHYCPEIYGDVV